jgi:hypothetical protein
MYPNINPESPANRPCKNIPIVVFISNTLEKMFNAKKVIDPATIEANTECNNVFQIKIDVKLYLPLNDTHKRAVLII